ncbi:hypothetical protein [Ructibacterium gallinarum]|nr:hypothetical protein [Ructibacterium gallinarum]
MFGNGCGGSGIWILIVILLICCCCGGNSCGCGDTCNLNGCCCD